MGPWVLFDPSWALVPSAEGHLLQGVGFPYLSFLYDFILGMIFPQEFVSGCLLVQWICLFGGLHPLDFPWWRLIRPTVHTSCMTQILFGLGLLLTVCIMRFWSLPDWQITLLFSLVA